MSEATPEVEGGPPPLAAPPGDALPCGARLAEFEIRSVLGAGGFGIVYLAWDHALEREVALKEYMPVSLAGRRPDGRVSVRAAGQAETFSLGLRSFVNEARLLARFDHPSLVKVYRFWEDNGTAYMAMPMVHGRTLRQVRQAMPPGSPGEAWCRALLEPLLGALECMHREEVFHRDIAPDNILLTDDGRPVLLDFGAARRVIGDRSHAITAIVKPNFAPIEQYADVAAVRQGPWTDLYALAATMYYLLTGQPPLPAAARALHDELVPLSRLKPAECSEEFLAAIDWAMAVRPKDRPQSLALWRDVLEGRMAVPARVRTDVTLPNVTSVQLQQPAGQVLDFDPTQPWPGSTGGHRPMPPVSPAGPAGEAEAAVAPPAFADTQPHGLGDRGAASRGSRRWAVGAGAAAALALIAVLAWRASSTPAVTPAESVDPALAAASAASSVSAASEAAAAGSGGGIASTAPASVTVASTATVPGLAPPPAAPPGRAVEPAAALPREVILPSVPGRAAVASGPIAENPASGAAAATRSAPRERERERERPPRERDRDPAPGTRQAAAAPSDRCADKNFLLKPMCMKRECDSDPRLRSHPECVRMQQAEQERRDVMLTR